MKKHILSFLLFFFILLVGSGLISSSDSLALASNTEVLESHSNLEQADQEINSEDGNIIDEILPKNVTQVEGISDIVTSLLESQTKELETISLERDKILAYLKENLAQYRIEIRNVAQSFQNIKLIFQPKQEEPYELTILIKQTNRLIYDLERHSLPFEQTFTQVEARLAELDALKKNLQTITTVNTNEISSTVNRLINSYTTFHNSLSGYVPEAKKILEEMSKTNAVYEKIMPSIWLKYYLYSASSLFSVQAWISEINNFNKLPTNFSLIINSELPQGRDAWFSFLSQVATTLLILSILVYFLNRSINYLPAVFQDLWKNIPKKSIFFIVLGTALYLGANNSGNYYRIVSSIASIMLCYGQITLTWQVYRLNNKVNSDKSPYIHLIYPFAGSLILPPLSSSPLLVALIWLTFVIVMYYRISHSDYKKYPLPSYILNGFRAVLVLDFFLIISGYFRLSILTSVTYSCIAIGIHQVIACLNISGLTQEYFPKKGLKVFFFGLAHALIMPLVLIIAFGTPIFWLFAYPGGLYLFENLSNFNFSVGEVSFNTVQIFSILTVFYLTRSLIAVSCNYIDQIWGGYQSKNVVSLATPIKTIIIFGLYGLLGIYILAVIGFSLTSLAVVAGGLSVGIGLGLQGVVQNIFAGFSLIFGQNIREGDVVEVSGIFGVIKKVSLRATQVKTYDNAIVFVPNSEFLATSFINWTHNGRMVRCTMAVGVAYGSDMPLVMQLIDKTVKEQDYVLHYPEPLIFFTNFGASSLDLELRFWIRELDEKLSALTKMRLAISQVFAENNIEIPFPQTDLHIKTMPEK